MRKISIKYMKLKGDYEELVKERAMHGMFVLDLMTLHISSRELIKEEVSTELKKDINDIEGCINDLDMSLEEVRNSDLWDRIGGLDRINKEGYWAVFW